MIRRHRTATLIVTLGLAALSPAITASAATTTGTARASFTAATDTSPQLVGGETSPRGNATLTQASSGAIVLNATFSGLRPLTSYVVVPYKDGACIPIPGVTAFPSPPFTTGTTGRATLSAYPVNPAAINPVGALSVNEINSVSIRQVVTTLDGLTIPDAVQTEACDTTITH